MTTTTRDFAHLVDLADELGLTIVERRGATRGGYHDGLRRIRLNPGQSARVNRSFLAHEIAHALYRDAPSPYAAVAAKQERRAWEWAALYLIDPEQYAAAERLREGHPASIAYDPGVTVELIAAFKGVLLRVDGATYVSPKMGEGQWMHRFTESSIEHQARRSDRALGVA